MPSRLVARSPRAEPRERQRRRLRGGCSGENPGSATGGLAPRTKSASKPGARRQTQSDPRCATPQGGGSPGAESNSCSSGASATGHRSRREIRRDRKSTRPGVCRSRKSGWQMPTAQRPPHPSASANVCGSQRAIGATLGREIASGHAVKSALESPRDVSKQTNRSQSPQPDFRRMRAQKAEGIPASGSHRAKPARKAPAPGVPREAVSARAPASSRKKRAEESARLRSKARQGVPEVRDRRFGSLSGNAQGVHRPT